VLRRHLLTVLLAMLAAAPSAHAIGWVSGEPLSPPGRVAGPPQVGLAPTGARSVAWEQYDALGSTVEGVGVRSAQPGGAFAEAQLFPGQVTQTTMAVGGDGTMGLAWVAYVGGKYIVHAARRAPGQASFTASSPLVLPSESAGLPAVAVQGGDIYVSFMGFLYPSQSSIYVARMPADAVTLTLIPGTGPESSLQRATFGAGQDPTYVQYPSIAADSAAVYVAWEHEVYGPTTSQTFVNVSSRSPGANFSAPSPKDTITVTSTSPDIASPVIAAGGGHAYVAWLRTRENRIDFQDVTAGPKLTLAAAKFPQTLEVAADPGGALVAAWTATPATNDRARVVESIVVKAGDAPGPPTQVTPIGAVRALDDLAVGPDGSALVVDGRGAGSFDTTVQTEASLRPPGSVFGPLEQVSGLQDATGYSHTLVGSGAVGTAGRALVAWVGADHTQTRNQRVFLSERDATAPEIGTLVVPATATAGATVALAAAATDALSPVTLTWDFGDGSGATGDSVNHVFGAPGTFTVTLTARDGAGNASTRSATIVVTAAPTAGDGGGGAAAEPDRTAPVVSVLRSANARFRAGARATALIAATKKSPVGTTFGLRLTERATLVLQFRRKGNSRVLGTIVRVALGPGAVSVPFSGRVGTTRLTPGTYRVTATAIDGAGNRSKAVSVSFKVVRR